ncbi:unnamed protein product [Rhizophagus irregularis]|nr:unnamed protein product [Rhizophagus irregularis]
MKVAWSSYYRTSLELFVETPQQAFSNWSFQLLRDAFKLNASSWDTLAEFQGQRLRSSGGHTSTELYGIVTTALEWFIIKVIETDCIEEPIDVKISNLTPINLPLTDRKLSKDKLLEPVKDLFSQILWIFNDQF